MTEFGIGQCQQHQLPADHVTDNDSPVIKPLVEGHEPGHKRCGCNNNGQIVPENKGEFHFG